MKNLKQWHLKQSKDIPASFLQELQTYANAREGKYLSQILWQRGIDTVEKLREFLNYQDYKPASPFEFGLDMIEAINRIEIAMNNNQEKVAIWGDFDTDGITATCVLWEGLGYFFEQNLNLKYYIPNRFNEFHGLSFSGIKKLADWGVNLIITCDIGGINFKEIDYLNELGIDLIMIDHNVLPKNRPSVISIINPLYLPINHKFYHFSSVAIAYKLMEALEQKFPNIYPISSEELLDLVAIGLIGDLVNLRGENRYLAKKGIDKLKITKRYGIKKLIDLCQQSGDRVTDVFYGIIPRINTVIRMKENADFCIDLLTSKNEKLCISLAQETEIANTIRKEIENKVFHEAKKQVETQLDLSSISIIILINNQWENSVLGLVANKISQKYGKPTILLTTAFNNPESNFESSSNTKVIARGSACSINNINLYNLISSQVNLLEHFAGNAYALDLEIAVENIPFFITAINQKLRQKIDFNNYKNVKKIDLIITVKELGKELFNELKLLEPFCLNNLPPKLLIKNCWFENCWNQNEVYQKNNQTKKVKYPKTTFKICDDSQPFGFNGIWWGYSADDLIENKRYDVVVDLDFNSDQIKDQDSKNKVYKDKEENYKVRLIDLKFHEENDNSNENMGSNFHIIDNRNQELILNNFSESLTIINDCPSSWGDLQNNYQQSLQNKQKLALSYQYKSNNSAEQIWLNLVQFIKSLIKFNTLINQEKLISQLEINPYLLNLGLTVLDNLGISYKLENNQFQFFENNHNIDQIKGEKNLKIFLKACQELDFKQNYFYRASLPIIESTLFNSKDNTLN